MRDYLKSLLEPHGDVDVVADGVAAAMALKDDFYDLLLADVVLPKLSGFELLRQVRNDPVSRLMAVILLSSAAGSDTRAESLQAGADDYVFKPFVARDLVSRVRSRLSVARMHADALRQSEERFRKFAEASSDVLWIRDAATLAWEYLGKAFDTIYGVPREQALGGDNLRSWTDLIIAEDRVEALKNVFRVRDGEHVSFEFRIRRPADGELRWIRNTEFPMLAESGRVTRIGSIGRDISEEKAASGRMQLLIAELQHRTRNLIAVTQALADRTVRESHSLRDFKDLYAARLRAVSRVQGLLSRLGDHERISFDELLRVELAAHARSNEGAERVRLDGPAGIRLRSGTVQTLALAIHELVTNAVKYGALSAPDGVLTVKWHAERASSEAPQRLHVEWREQGVGIGCAPDAVRSRGYGRELIEAALPYQLGAQTTYDLGVDGVLCTISVPLADASE
jgi:two-component system CheB/CheR fusion protein